MKTVWHWADNSVCSYNASRKHIFLHFKAPVTLCCVTFSCLCLSILSAMMS